MNKKIKILIGILIVGILLIGGWWVWKQNTIERQSISTYNIIKNCTHDNECVCSGRYGCINKNSVLPPVIPEDKFKCIGVKCSCINNRCIQKLPSLKEVPEVYEDGSYSVKGFLNFAKNKDLKNKNFTLRGIIYDIYECHCPPGVRCKICPTGLTLADPLASLTEKNKLIIDYAPNCWKLENLQKGEEVKVRVHFEKYGTIEGKIGGSLKCDSFERSGKIFDISMIKEESKEMTCNEKCISLGYASGTCKKFAISPEGIAKKCGEGEISISGASDCKLPTYEGHPIVGVGITCCCKVKEGVSLSTDKTEYEQGEIVKIKLTNLGKETIKIQKIGKCHLFEVFDSNGKRISIDEPNCELFEIYHSPQYIKPNETKVIDFWDQTIYENQKKKQVLPGLYKIKAFGTETKIKIKAKGVIIRTDKAEYKQGEKVKITVTNKLDIPIIFATTPRCGSSFWSLEKKVNDKWEEIAYYIPCLWEAPDFHYTRLDPNQSLEDIWYSNVWSWPEKWYIAKPGIYRIRLDYVIPEVIKTEKLGNLICEKLPEELEKLLKSGEWVKTGNETCERKVRVGSEEKPCTPPTCGCGCIAKDVWSINNVARIDIDYWYCHGDMDKYWIKYQNTSYLCFPEYVKKYYPIEYHIEKRFFRKLGKLQREAVYAEFKVEPLFSKPHDNLTLPIDFLKCKKDKDCILGEKCGQVCFNKEFKEWYDKNVGVCMYRKSSNVSCKCKENRCQLSLDCEAECIRRGFDSGICRTFSINEEVKCKKNEFEIGETSDCTIWTKEGHPIVGVRKICCCFHYE